MNNFPTKPYRETHRRDFNKDYLGTSEEKCRQRLLQKLADLKDSGQLKESLLPQTSEFESLEFYGDAVLYQTISEYIMRTRRFMDPHLMTQLRMNCIRNSNLAQVFDLLHLESLLRDRTYALPLKSKADVVEAMIGEIDEKDVESSVLNELTAYIAYLGEKSYVSAQVLPQRSNATDKSRLYQPTVNGQAHAAPEPSKELQTQMSSSMANPRSKTNERILEAKDLAPLPQQAASPSNTQANKKRKSDPERAADAAPAPVERPAVPKPLFYNPPEKKESTPTAAKPAPKLAKQQKLQENLSGKSQLPPHVREVKTSNPNPETTIHEFVREAPRANAANAAKVTAAQQRNKEKERKVAELLDMLKSGETKLIAVPLVLADSSSRVTYEYR